MNRFVRRVATMGVATSVIGIFAACSDSATVAPEQSAQFTLGSVPGSPGPNVGQADIEYFEVCKEWVGVTDPSFDADFLIEVTSHTGTSVPDQTITLANDADHVQCQDVWVHGGTGYDDVTVTEQTALPNFTTTVVRTWILDGVAQTADAGTSGLVDGDSGVLVYFTNTLIPTGGEGCTPGYWKNHAGVYSWSRGGQNKPSAWEGYSPTEYFDDVFGVGPHVTLITALTTGGGGAAALGRHAVAALLNAAHSGVDYDLTPAEVIAEVQAAYASGDYQTSKNLLASLNEQGCPL